MLIEKSEELRKEELIHAVQRFGNNSNSFMTLYRGFHYFTSHRSTNSKTQGGVIAYVNQQHAWVGGAEPLTDSHLQMDLLNEFADAAHSEKKSAILIPVGKSLTAQAIECGFGSILIGWEPVFDLKRYPKTGRTWIDVVPTAKLLDSKGARVTELDPPSISATRKAELDAITQEWLESRKMDPLGFLNQVEPWTLSEHKRYFCIELGGKTLAFLAAIPIFPRRGWYLIDLMRRNDAPPGSTELLTLQSMRLLQESGAEEITFGVSPLSQLENLENMPLAKAKDHLFLYRALRFLYQKGNSFYNFKSLYQYKLKFEPTSWEPAFLLYKDPHKNLHAQKGISPLAALSVFQTFSGHGILHSTISILRRSFKHFNPPAVVSKQLRNSIVVRSVPQTWGQFLYRCKFTLTMMITNVILFLATTNSSGILTPSIERSWGYSLDSLLDSPAHALLLSPFLHWNLLHLNANLALLIFFGGALEYFAGTGIIAASYLVTMVFSNPLTTLFGTLSHLIPSHEIDVGASLGIFGCVGTLSWFLRHRLLLLSGFAIGPWIQAFTTGDWLVLNHWTALLLGVLMGRILL